MLHCQLKCNFLHLIRKSWEQIKWVKENSDKSETNRLKLVGSVNCVRYSSRIKSSDRQPANVKYNQEMGIAWKDQESVNSLIQK